MAKLQEHSMTSAVWGDNSDEVTYLDLLSNVRLPPRACHSILKKLLGVILRPDTTELLKRRWVRITLSSFPVGYLLSFLDNLSRNRCHSVLEELLQPAYLLLLPTA